MPRFLISQQLQHDMYLMGSLLYKNKLYIHVYYNILYYN